MECYELYEAPNGGLARGTGDNLRAPMGVRSAVSSAGIEASSAHSFAAHSRTPRPAPNPPATYTAYYDAQILVAHKALGSYQWQA